MSRSTFDPVRYVITFRVNDEEKKALEQLAKGSNKSVSKYMRLLLQAVKDEAGSHQGSCHPVKRFYR